MSSVATKQRAPVEAGPPPLLPRRLSAVDLTDDSECPKRVWFRRVAQVRLEEEPSQVLALGNAVHAALYMFFGLKPADREPLETRLHQCLRAVWREHTTPDLFDAGEEEKLLGARGLELLSNFAQRFTTDAVPLARERWLDLRLPNGVRFRGKADRIDGEVQQARKGTLEVIDYKTGRKMLDDDEIVDEPAAQIYLLAVEQMYQREVHRVRFLYLAHGEDARWEPEREDVELVRERLVARTNEMLADQEFVARPGAQCARCRFAHLCADAGRVELTDLEVDDELGF